MEPQKLHLITLLEPKGQFLREIKNQIEMCLYGVTHIKPDKVFGLFRVSTRIFFYYQQIKQGLSFPKWGVTFL